MLDFVQWIALLGAIGIGILFLVEVRKWRQLGSVMTRSQRILRVLLIVAIEGLFVMMLVGPSVTGRNDPITSLLYWTVCLVLGFVVVVLALLDVRGVVTQYVRLNRQIFRELRDDPCSEQNRGEHPETRRRPEDNGRET